MNLDELTLEVKEVMDEIDNSFIMYPLKEYGVKYIRKETIETVKLCYILSYLGFKITTNLVSGLTDRNVNSVSTTLSKLGDKRIIYLLGYDYKGKRQTPILIYTMDKAFNETLHIETNRLKRLKERLSKEGLKI